MPTLVLVVGVLLAALVGIASAPGSAGTFRVEGGPGLRAALDDALAASRPPARAVLRGIADRVTVTTAGVRACGGVSCTSEGDGRMTVHVARHDLRAPAAERRAVLLHELGHAADRLLLDGPERTRLAWAIVRDPGWQPCAATSRRGRACPALREVFADLFARWALGSVGPVHPYQSPRLVLEGSFGSLVAGPLAEPGGDAWRWPALPGASAQPDAAAAGPSGVRPA